MNVKHRELLKFNSTFTYQVFVVSWITMQNKKLILIISELVIKDIILILTLSLNSYIFKG